MEIDGLSYPSIDGETKTIETMLGSSFTDAFLVVHNGTLVTERYDNGMAVDSLHLVNSITKSFVGMLAGIAVDQGVLFPDAPLSDYLPD